jgi:hypothetical protein
MRLATLIRNKAKIAPDNTIAQMTRINANFFTKWHIPGKQNKLTSTKTSLVHSTFPHSLSYVRSNRRKCVL